MTVFQAIQFLIIWNTVAQREVKVMTLECHLHVVQCCRLQTGEERSACCRQKQLLLIYLESANMFALPSPFVPRIPTCLISFASTSAHLHNIAGSRPEMGEERSTCCRQKHFLLIYMESANMFLFLSLSVPRIPTCLIYFAGDRGSTVVKVLCYKLEGHWFDSRWS